MKTKLTLLLLVFVVACGIAMRFNSPVAVKATRPAMPPEAPAVTLAQQRTESGTSASPMQPETEVVMGIEVRKDRSCSVQRHYVDLGNGTVTEAYSCVPHATIADDYERYSDEELRVLSYSDARAASVLGKRLVEVDLNESRRLLLRAVALQPANLDPVMWLAAQAYSLRGNSPAADSARANTYILTRTAQAMGSGASVDWVLEDLARAGFDEAHIARLDESVRENLRRIREIQIEVYGETLVDEVLL